MRFPHSRYAAWQAPPWTVALFTGSRGEGKSTLVHEYIRNVRRAAMWDPKVEYAGTLGGPQMNAREFFERSTQLRNGVLRVSVHSRFGPLRSLDDPPDADALAEDYELFARGCWKAKNLLCGTEEISSTGASANFCPAALEQLVNFGRDTRGVALLVVGQRAAQIPTVVRAQASEWCAFRQSRNEDAEALLKTFGDAAADVRRLPRHHFIHWTPQTGPVPQGP